MIQGQRQSHVLYTFCFLPAQIDDWLYKKCYRELHVKSQSVRKSKWPKSQKIDFPLIQWSQKVSLRPETGKTSPQNDQNNATCRFILWYTDTLQ